MKIVFIGGTRFIGLSAVRLAHQRGHSVSVIHRGVHNSTLPAGVEELYVDRNDRLSLSNALKDTKPDVVVDTFVMTASDAKLAIESLEGNTENIVILSSQDVYAQFGSLNGHPTPIIEDIVYESSPLTIPFPFRGLADHAGGTSYDKKEVESQYMTAAEKMFASTTVLRLPAVYGHGDYQRRFKPVIDSLKKGMHKMPCQSRANWRWTQGHVENMAHAIILAAEKQLSGYQVFNVGELHVPTMRERVESFANLMETSIEWEEVEQIPAELAILGKMPNDFVVSTEKIRESLGYREVLSEKECYLDLIEWSLQNRALE